MNPVKLLLVASIVVVAASISAAPQTDRAADGWSKPDNGIEARITMVERKKFNGTRMLVPYFELRNVTDNASPIHVRCDNDYVKFELIDADGNARDEWFGLLRGFYTEPGTIVLPMDSSIRIGMYCRNWGVPKDAPAMIATDSGAWVLKPEEKGKVFLRATISGEASDDSSRRVWHGTITTPQVRIDWSK